MGTDTENQALRQTTLAVSGMTCGGCARTIERVLARVPGVTSAAVDFSRGLAIGNGSTTPPDLGAAGEAAGYCA